MQCCRSSWLGAVFDGEAKAAEYASKRGTFYDCNEIFLTKTNASGPHVVDSKPSFADALLFGQLWDDFTIVKGDLDMLKTHPKVEAFWKAYKEQEGVKEWCQSTNPELASC